MLLFLLPRGKPRRRQERAAQAGAEVQQQKGHMALETRSRSTCRRHTNGTHRGMPAGRVTGTSSPTCLVSESVTGPGATPKAIFRATLVRQANHVRRSALSPDMARRIAAGLVCHIE